MDQKRPNFDFKPQNLMSNSDFIRQKIIFYLEYWISGIFFIITMKKFLKKGSIFVVSFATQNKSSEKTIC